MSSVTIPKTFRAAVVIPVTASIPLAVTWG